MIDFEHLTRQTAGDPSLQCELLDLFDAQLDGLAADLSAHGERPRDAEQAVMHRVRGAASAVGAFDLAQSLEQAEARIAGRPLSQAESAALAATIGATRQAIAGLIAALRGGSLAKAGESR